MSLMGAVVAILNREGTGMVAQIRDNLKNTSTNATGKTQQSLSYHTLSQQNKASLTISGRPYFMAVETGRRPTPDKKPPMAMVEAIKEWMNVRGIEGSAYGLAMGIQKNGSRLWRQGGRKDIVSNVINDEGLSKIQDDILKTIGDEVLANMILAFNTGRKIA